MVAVKLVEPEPKVRWPLELTYLRSPPPAREPVSAPYSDRRMMMVHDA